MERDKTECWLPYFTEEPRNLITESKGTLLKNHGAKF